MPGSITTTARTNDPDEGRFIKPCSVKGNIEEIGSINSLECGFRQNFFDGSVGGIEFEAASGAGCGNTLVTFQIGDRHFRMDVKEIAFDLIEEVTGKRPE